MKQLISLALALCLSLTLFGCTAGQDGSSSSTVEESSTTSMESSTASLESESSASESQLESEASPEETTDLVFQITAQWTSYEDVGGTVSYPFTTAVSEE